LADDRKRLGRSGWLLPVLLLLGACAGTAKVPVETLTRPDVAAVLTEPSVLDVYDPLERFNRGVYEFNARFDRYVFLPAVRAYEFITPNFVQNRVADFIRHLSEPFTFANSLLQGRGPRAGRAATRFIVNTLFTLGLYDLAGARGIEGRPEDFGQTLGVWGVGDGPYLVLPILGPSNLRDATGTGVTAGTWFVAIPPDISTTLAYRLTTFGLFPIDTRRRTEFRYFGTDSPFEYELVRLLYTEKRRFEIAN